MPTHACRRAAGVALFALALPAISAAQTIGTFHWRMEPYCNTLTLTVVQDAAGIRLQGFEDLCEPIYAPQAVEGSAVLGNDGMARVGLSTSVSSGRVASFDGNRVILSIDVSTLNGSWADDAGRVGTLLRVSTPTTSGTQRGDEPNTFLHVVTADNRGAVNNVSCFSHPLSDGNPGALVLMTRNRGSQTSIRPLVASTVSLYYDDNGTGAVDPDLASDVWCLSRDDSQTMPIDAGFTIRIVPR